MSYSVQDLLDRYKGIAAGLQVERQDNLDKIGAADRPYIQRIAEIDTELANRRLLYDKFVTLLRKNPDFAELMDLSRQLEKA